MKNILIITNQPHTYIGGIETYNCKLISLLSKLYNVYEYAYVEHDFSKITRSRILPINQMSRINKNLSKEYINHFKFGCIHRFIANIFITKKIKAHFTSEIKRWRFEGINFDAYIDTTNIFFNEIDYSKLIFCQHFDNSDYEKSEKLTVKLAYLIKKLFNTHKTSLGYAKKIVTLNLDGNFLNLGNVVDIVYSDTQKVTRNDFYTRKNICFIGRFSVIKGSEKIKQIAKMLGTKIHIYGTIDEDSKIDEWIEYKGIINNSDVVNTLVKYKMSILPSSHREGLPLSLLDSLNAGTPIITLKNKWYNEKLLNSGNVGISIDDDIALDPYIVEIKSILNDENKWLTMSSNCIIKYNKLTEKKFDSSWLNEIKQLIE